MSGLFANLTGWLGAEMQLKLSVDPVDKESTEQDLFSFQLFASEFIVRQQLQEQRRVVCQQHLQLSAIVCAHDYCYPAATAAAPAQNQWIRLFHTRTSESASTAAPSVECSTGAGWKGFPATLPEHFDGYAAADRQC